MTQVCEANRTRRFVAVVLVAIAATSRTTDGLPSSTEILERGIGELNVWKGTSRHWDSHRRCCAAPLGRSTPDRIG